MADLLRHLRDLGRLLLWAPLVAGGLSFAVLMAGVHFAAWVAE